MERTPTSLEIKEAIELLPPEYLEFTKVLADAVKSERKVVNEE